MPSVRRHLIAAMTGATIAALTVAAGSLVAANTRPHFSSIAARKDNLLATGDSGWPRTAGGAIWTCEGGLEPLEIAAAIASVSTGALLLGVRRPPILRRRACRAPRR
jgi:hypothetical protein